MNKRIAIKTNECLLDTGSGGVGYTYWILAVVVALWLRQPLRLLSGLCKKIYITTYPKGISADNIKQKSKKCHKSIT